MTKVAINGLGRIGRAALKIALDTPELEVVAVNDIASLENIAYLIKYDTVYGRYQKDVQSRDGMIVIDDQEIIFLSEREPQNLPWGEMGVQLVFECAGLFTRQEDAGKHIQAGAKHVIISAPTKSASIPTVVHGVNRADEKAYIISCASCTTNNITPIIEIMNRRIGVKKAIMTTVHAYTSSQQIVDAPGRKDMRRGRTAAANMVPTSTGAAIAATKALPELEGKFDGVAVRVPVAVGSLADVTLITERPTRVEEVNDIFREEAATDRYKGVLGVTADPIVSSDIVQDPRASIIDLGMTQVVDGDLVKIMSWYDNEWGYTSQMVRQALEVIGAKTTV